MAHYSPIGVLICEEISPALLGVNYLSIEPVIGSDTSPVNVNDHLHRGHVRFSELSLPNVSGGSRWWYVWCPILCKLLTSMTSKEELMSTLQQSAVAAELMGNARFENSGASIAALRPDLLTRVSAAQQRVLEFLLGGMTEPQIAEKIGRSRHTVHDHTKAIYSSLNVNNRVQLVLLFSQPQTNHAPQAAAPIQQSAPSIPSFHSSQPGPISATTGQPQQARPLQATPISDVVFTQARPIGPAKNLAVA